MPVYQVNPDPPPLTQAELDALAAQQRAMGGAVPDGGYVAEPTPSPSSAAPVHNTDPQTAFGPPNYIPGSTYVPMHSRPVPDEPLVYRGGRWMPESEWQAVAGTFQTPVPLGEGGADANPTIRPDTHGVPYGGQTSPHLGWESGSGAMSRADPLMPDVARPTSRYKPYWEDLSGGRAAPYAPAAVESSVVPHKPTPLPPGQTPEPIPPPPGPLAYTATEDEMWRPGTPPSIPRGFPSERSLPTPDPPGSGLAYRQMATRAGEPVPAVSATMLQQMATGQQARWQRQGMRDPNAALAERLRGLFGGR